MRASLLSTIFICLVLMTFSRTAAGSELKLTNLSKIEISPTVASDSSRESFGVVSIDGSETVGSSPFTLGDKVQILWEEGESYHLSNTDIDTSGLQNISKEVASIHLIYHGKGSWVLKVFDRNDHEIGSVP